MIDKRERSPFFHDHPDAMWIYDKEKQIFLDVNQAALDIYEYTHSEFLSMTIADLSYSEGCSPRRSVNIRPDSSQQDDDRVRIHLKKSNQIVHVYMRSRDFLFQDRHAQLVCIRDVTEEQAKANHLRMLETTVSNLNDILLITEAEPIDGPEGPRVIYVNDAFVRRTGYSRDEIIGKTPRLLQGPKTQRDRLDKIRQAMESWQVSRTELINYTKDGEEFWLELEIIPISDETGWYTHWVAVERDITERKAVEESISVNEERFRLLAEVTSGAIWDWNVLSGYVWRSSGFKTEFGYEPDNVHSNLDWWLDKIHTDDRIRVSKTFENTLSSNSKRWQDDYRFLHNDGKYRNVEDRGLIMRNEIGDAIRVIGSRKDVTEKLIMEEVLRHTQRLDAIGQLTGGVAHDFNNLLTVILSSAELLTEGLSDQAQLRMLAEMTVTAAERGAELTHRLLAFARRQALDPKLVDLNRLVAGIEAMLRRTLPESINIEFVRAGGLWSAELDPGQFESALINLAVNARDAMPSGGCLTIETANTQLDDEYAKDHVEVRPGQYVLLSVSDTGTGMTSEMVVRAFEPFFTTKEVGKGTGLGLSMAYGFVKQSGGHIKIYSEVDQGTTIKLYFPRSKSAADAEIKADSTSPTVGSGEVILVVEDDLMVRQNLVGQLESLGYAVISAASGAEALVLLKNSKNVDLLFTDIVMPGGMNGRVLADEAKRSHPNLKVLFTSGYTENAIVHHGRLDSGVHLLTKPYRRNAMAAKVRLALGKDKTAVD